MVAPGDDVQFEAAEATDSLIRRSIGSSPVSENECPEVLGLTKDPEVRRAWLLYLAQKSLPFDQAIEWARNAEQFITGSTTGSQPVRFQDAGSKNHRRGAGIRDAILQLLSHNPKGLSRGDLLDHLSLKGDKTGETAVSNALTALTKRGQVVRRERKYFAG